MSRFFLITRNETEVLFYSAQGSGKNPPCELGAAVRLSKPELEKKFLECENGGKDGLSSEKDGWLNKSVCAFVMVEPDGTRHIQDSFVVITREAMAAARVQHEINVMRQHGRRHAETVAGFQAKIAAAAPEYIAEVIAVHAQSLSYAEGYSAVFNRCADTVESLQIAHNNRNEPYPFHHAQVIEGMRGIYNYFMSGVLRSSSAASSSAMCNLQENAKRDGILAALRHMAHDLNLPC
ncbi:MAG: hypothetical protein Q7U75_02185 [Desulfobacterales bacterium]|nr:hypothetical protein [Desulfobacterales bacterium]